MIIILSAPVYPQHPTLYFRLPQALEKVPDQEEWKVRNLMSLAMCQAETKPDEAPKTLQRAYDLAVTAKLDAIKKEVAMLQVGKNGACDLCYQ